MTQMIRGGLVILCLAAAFFLLGLLVGGTNDFAKLAGFIAVLGIAVLIGGLIKGPDRAD